MIIVHNGRMALNLHHALFLLPDHRNDSVVAEVPAYGGKAARRFEVHLPWSQLESAAQKSPIVLADWEEIMGEPVSKTPPGGLRRPDETAPPRKGWGRWFGGWK